MNLLLLSNQLEDIKESSSRLEKEAILEEILNSENSELFKRICNFIYNPYLKLNVRVTSSILDESDFSEEYNDELIVDKFFGLIDKFSSGELSGNLSREALREFFSSIPFYLHEWFAMFFNKNMKIGLGRPTLEKFVNLPSNFSVQLCSKYDGELPFGFPAIINPKLNGLRGTCGVLNGVRQALSRNGKPVYNVDYVIKFSEFIKEKTGEEYIIDGELGHGWNDSMSIVKTESRHKDSENLIYYVFDIIPEDEFSKQVCTTPLFIRLELLSKLVSEFNDPHIVLTKYDTVESHEEILCKTKEYVAEGYEGSVIKNPVSMYEYERSKDWLKFKFVNEVDAVVVDVLLGLMDPINNNIIDEDDPRAGNANFSIPVIRSLVVLYNGIRTKVGSGLKMHERYSFYEAYVRGELIGKVVEVKYQEFSSEGKLLFPRFVRIRHDK